MSLLPISVYIISKSTLCPTIFYTNNTAEYYVLLRDLAFDGYNVRETIRVTGIME